MEIAFFKNLNETKFGYEEPLKPLNRLYEILVKLKMHENDCIIEKN
jgi:hypothetical protein